MEKIIKVDAKKLSQWWLMLNRWIIPKELEPVIKNRDFVRGAFTIVNSIVSLIEVKKILTKKEIKEIDKMPYSNL